jgi:hypothetical protein
LTIFLNFCFLGKSHLDRSAAIAEWLKHSEMRSEFEPAPWDILGQGRKRKKEEIKKEITYIEIFFYV